MLYLNLTDFSTASKKLNLNNVAEVERKESLFSLPKCSNVSKKHRTNNVRCRDRREQHRILFVRCRDQREQHRILLVR